MRNSLDGLLHLMGDQQSEETQHEILQRKLQRGGQGIDDAGGR
jgi:hypothetical protein